MIAALERLQAAGATLNPAKCKFRQKMVKFLRHLIDERGIRADPDKTSVLLKMEPPQNITDLRRFMGMANQLGKFSHRLAEVSQPFQEISAELRPELCRYRCWYGAQTKSEPLQK